MASPSFLRSEDAVREQVARYVEIRSDAIVREWVEAVRSDPAIPSADKLTHTAIEDHFPELLQELASLIRRESVIPEEEQVKTTASAHGRARWKNGYRLDEVLRELSRIRQMLVRQIQGVVEGQPAGLVVSILRDVDHFFCVVAATSALQFVEAQNAELHSQDQQLSGAYERAQSASEEIKRASELQLRLLRAVSHEFRNAIQPILLAATLLKDSSTWDPEMDTSMTNSAFRLQLLVAALPEISLLLTGKSPVVVKRFMSSHLLEALEEQRSAAESKGLSFETRLRSQDFEVYSDENKIRSIAGELVKNAIKFTPSGFVRVEIEGTVNEHWTLQVADSGLGVGADVATQIFGELHSPPSDVNAGARLGLVVAHYLVHLLGGDLSFVTEPGVGSVFRLKLPQSGPPE